jgi:RNA polymerase sigma-70 factor (ECF subfamily)
MSLYAPLVHHWCVKMGLAKEDAADVVQEVFQAVTSSIGGFVSQPGGTFRGWLRTITRNKVRDHFRRRRCEPSAAGGTEACRAMSHVADLDDEPSGDEDDLRAEHAVLLRAIEMIRRDFKPETWQAFWCVVVEGKTTAEASQQLGMRPGTVRVAKSRVLHRLRQQLGDLLE